MQNTVVDGRWEKRKMKGAGKKGEKKKGKIESKMVKNA